MAQGTRNGGTGAVRDALDLCLLRLRQGESIEGCLANFPELADELRPLLDTYREIAADAPPAPTAPGGLVAGRERLLAAAAAGRLARTPMNGTPPVAARDALDRALAGLRAGEPVDTLVAAHAGPDLPAERLREMLALAAVLDAEAKPAPAPDGRLAAGRERFLAAAGALAAARGAEAPDALDDEAVDEAVNAALARARAGEPLETPSEDAEMLGLLGVLAAVRREAPPPPRGRLDPGRARLLQAAAVRRAAAMDTEGATSAVAADLLDEALARVRGGQPIEEAVAGRSREVSAELRALLLAAGRIEDEALPAPAPELAPGRALLLGAAALRRGELPDLQRVTPELLDTALARLAAGEAADEVVAGCQDELALALRGLLDTALALRDQAVTPPAAELAAGRARLLETAERLRPLRVRQTETDDARAAGPLAGLGAGLSAWLGGAMARPRGRVALMAAVLLGLLFGGQVALSPVSASARPDDGLLYRHKLFTQDLRLIVASVRPEWREAVRTEVNEERYDDLAYAQRAMLQEPVDIKVQGRLRGVEETGGPDQPPQGLIHIAADESPRHVSARWHADETDISLPRGYRRLGEIPGGTQMNLKLRSQGGANIALSISTSGLAPLVPLTGTVTATLTAATPTLQPGTPTAVASATTAVTTTTPTATATEPSTPTATATQPLTPTATVTLAPSPTHTPTTRPPATEASRPRPEQTELEGRVMEPPTSAIWIVRRETSSRNDPDNLVGRDYVDVMVDVTGLDETVRGDVEQGDILRLRGRYSDGTRTKFQAITLVKRTPEAEACRDLSRILGTIAGYSPGVRLQLEDGSVYRLDDMGPGDIVGTPRVGATAEIVYRHCFGERFAERIEVADGQPGPGPEIAYNGVVERLDGPERFTLLVSGRPYTVDYDPATVTYLGAPASLAVGQVVDVEGTLEDEGAGRIDARTVTILRQPRPSATPAPPTATPTATTAALPKPPGGDPAPTATAEPAPPSQPADPGTDE